MSKEKKKFIDEATGIEATASSKIMAWQLIRNECHINKFHVPKIDKVKEVINSYPNECPNCFSDSDSLQPYDSEYYICEDCRATYPFLKKTV